MPSLVVAAVGAAGLTSMNAEGPNMFNCYNPPPSFAAITSAIPGSRFDALDNVYLMPTAAFGRHVEIVSIDLPTVPESFDVLPADLALTRERAFALGSQATALLSDTSPEVDLGSAL